MSRKVLLATMNVGGGHTALRDSFHSVLTQADPDRRRFEPILWDSSDKQLSRFYEFVVHYIPKFQQTVYDLSNSPLGVRLLASTSRPLLKEAKDILRRTQPDVILCTHVVLSMMLAKAKRELGLSATLFSAIPDYGVPTRGFFPEQEDLRGEFAIVMDETTGHHLVQQRGFPSSIIHWSGFLTRAPFTAISDQIGAAPRMPKDERAKLLATLQGSHPQLGKLDPSKPTLIFLGGSAWTSKTLPVISALLQRPALLERLNLIVVCGKNPDFEEKLKDRVADNPHVAVFGFVTAQLMAQLLGLSDYPILGSLAPATMHELLETRCGPLMLFHFIPGTEVPHVAFIDQNQIGLYEPDAELMVENIRELIGDKPAGARVASLLQRFPKRAVEMREANKTRAHQLSEFLERAVKVTSLPGPTVQPRSTQQPRSAAL